MAHKNCRLLRMIQINHHESGAKTKKIMCWCCRCCAADCSRERAHGQNDIIIIGFITIFWRTLKCTGHSVYLCLLLFTYHYHYHSHWLAYLFVFVLACMGRVCVCRHCHFDVKLAMQGPDAWCLLQHTLGNNHNQTCELSLVWMLAGAAAASIPQPFPKVDTAITDYFDWSFW